VIFIRDNIKGGALTETTYLILLALCRPNHGYGIMQFIEKETNGRVALGAGTLYGAINTLLKKGWIEPVGNSGGDAKKDYAITQLGRQIAADEQKRLTAVLRLATGILGGKAHE
jgi:DNA-binding PadR family transcriptional regulator